MTTQIAVVLNRALNVDPLHAIDPNLLDREDLLLVFSVRPQDKPVQFLVPEQFQSNYADVQGAIQHSKIYQYVFCDVVDTFGHESVMLIPAQCIYDVPANADPSTHSLLVERTRGLMLDAVEESREWKQFCPLSPSGLPGFVLSTEEQLRSVQDRGLGNLDDTFSHYVHRYTPQSAVFQALPQNAPAQPRLLAQSTQADYHTDVLVRAVLVYAKQSRRDSFLPYLCM